MSNSRPTLEGEADPDLRKLVKPLGGPSMPPAPSLLQPAPPSAPQGGGDRFSPAPQVSCEETRTM